MIKNILNKLVSVRRDKSRSSPLDHVAPEAAELARKVRSKNLTYLPEKKLARLITTLKRIVAEEVPGDCVEAGCALGGSSIIIGRLKPTNSTLRVHDVFDMIPPPTDEDGDDVKQRYDAIRAGESKGLGGDRYYGYEDDLIKKVRSNLAGFGVNESTGVELIQGLVQDTLVVDGPIAMAHIDVDWFDPVMCCLERIVPNLSIGGALILDDYNDWSGCRKAADKYFETNSKGLSFDSDGPNYIVTRTS